MRKQILFILSTLALLMHPLSLSAQNSTAGDQALTPDFDGDGRVGFPDFLAFAGQFGSRQGDGRYDARYDLDIDGEIGFSDFLIFSSSFGKSGSEAALIVIPDANLRAVIEDILGKASGAPITRAEMARLMRIEARNANIRDLTGLEFATRLTSLNFGDERVEGNFVNSNSITDITPLSGLANLTNLDLSDNSITDITPLSGMTSLGRLYLYTNSISDISPLVANTGLGGEDVVDVRNNPLSAISYKTHVFSLQDRGVFMLINRRDYPANARMVSTHRVRAGTGFSMSASYSMTAMPSKPPYGLLTPF